MVNVLRKKPQSKSSAPIYRFCMRKASPTKVQFSLWKLQHTPALPQQIRSSKSIVFFLPSALLSSLSDRIESNLPSLSTPSPCHHQAPPLQLHLVPRISNPHISTQTPLGQQNYTTTPWRFWNVRLQFCAMIPTRCFVRYVLPNLHSYLRKPQFDYT